MSGTLRVLEIATQAQAVAELARLDCHEAGIRIMQEKAVFKAIKLENIAAKAANLLKQTFLAKGGEAAVGRGTADLSSDFTDVLICGTRKQYRLALSQLKQQPWGLPDIAARIEQALSFADGFPLREYQWANRSLDIKPGKTLVMGILNLTPDSFSDGGKYNTLDAALRQMETMIADGADIIDIGAESTRPYGQNEGTRAREEMDRLLPILEKLLSACPLPISVDTYKAEVAQAALHLGAHMINDVWGLQYDSAMAGVIAKYDVPVIVMHNQDGTTYQRDILSHITAFLQKSMDIAVGHGVAEDKIILDPGIGFGKTPQQNLAVMSRLHELKALGCPLLLGASRKRFIGEVLGLPVEERVEGTGATVAFGMMKGANLVRVHDVKPISRVVRMIDAMMHPGEI